MGARFIQRPTGIFTRLLHSLLRRLRSLRQRDPSNVALQEELQFHLQRQTEENMNNGISPEEAHAAAER